MRAASVGPKGRIVRGSVTRDDLQAFMRELARSAPGRRSYRVYFVGGGTAVDSGWRESTIDVDLAADDESVFRDVQGIKERLQMNIEFARPEDFVPPLKGSSDRHRFIDTIGRVSFYHYDPYAQLFSKVVRGFNRDLQDAESFIRSGMVDPKLLLSLVRRSPEKAFAKYPTLTRQAVLDAVRDFVDRMTV